MGVDVGRWVGDWVGVTVGDWVGGWVCVVPPMAGKQFSTPLRVSTIG